MTPPQQRTESICVICGQPFTPATNRGRAKTCSPECSQQHNRNIALASKARRKGKTPGVKDPSTVTLISDPTPEEEGGFPPGVTFSFEQYVITRNMGFFATGTVVRKRNGQRYEIHGTHDYPLT